LRVFRVTSLTGFLAWLVSGAMAQKGERTCRSSDLRVVSSFVASGDMVPADCREQARFVALALAGYPQANAWHWVVACDQAAWQRFLRLSGRPGSAEILASTDLEGRTTYLRGDKLLHPDDLQADARMVIGHELAHIRLGSEDELSADRLSRVWLKLGYGSLLGRNRGP
jgi:hypothetical protein